MQSFTLHIFRLLIQVFSIRFCITWPSFLSISLSTCTCTYRVMSHLQLIWVASLHDSYNTCKHKITSIKLVTKRFNYKVFIIISGNKEIKQSDRLIRKHDISKSIAWQLLHVIRANRKLISHSCILPGLTHTHACTHTHV